MRFDEKSFFITVSGLTLFWDYKDYGKECFSERKRKLSIINKILLKGDCIDGSVLNGVRQPKLYSFVLDEPPGYKVFPEAETFHFKILNKSVLNTITFYSEVDKNEEFNFNEETLTFTLQMIKI